MECSGKFFFAERSSLLIFENSQEVQKNHFVAKLHQQRYLSIYFIKENNTRIRSSMNSIKPAKVNARVIPLRMNRTWKNHPCYYFVKLVNSKAFTTFLLVYKKHTQVTWQTWVYFYNRHSWFLLDCTLLFLEKMICCAILIGVLILMSVFWMEILKNGFYREYFQKK